MSTLGFFEHLGSDAPAELHSKIVAVSRVDFNLGITELMELHFVPITEMSRHDAGRPDFLHCTIVFDPPKLRLPS